MPPPTPAPARVRRRRGGRTGQAVAGAALPCDVNTPQTLSFISPPPPHLPGEKSVPPLCYRPSTTVVSRFGFFF